jgi:hypothetical protein
MLMSLIIAAGALTAPAALPPCRPAHLRLSLDGRDGDFNGMSHGGTALTIRNVGPACTLPALPIVTFRDARGRALPASRRAPVGMHPGPVMLPVRLAAGHGAVAELRWVSGPVFSRNRSISTANVSVRIGGGTLRAPLRAVPYGEAGQPVWFDQTPLRAVEGMTKG